MSDFQKNIAFVLFVGGVVAGLFLLSPPKNNGSSKKIQENPDPKFIEGRRLFAEQRCTQCHKFYGVGGNKGPDLTHVRKNLLGRMKNYEKEVKALEKKHPEEYKESLPLLEKILKTETTEERVRIWMFEHLKRPAFDNPETEMPWFSFEDPQVEALSFFLLNQKSK